MSPALTRQHSQDVVDANEDHCQSDLGNTAASLVNTLSKPFLFPESLEGDSRSSIRRCNGTKAAGLSLHTDESGIEPNNAGVSPYGNSNNNSCDENPIKLINTSMTPRIVLPHIKTTSSLQFGNGTQEMELNDVELYKNPVVNVSAGASPSESVSTKHSPPSTDEIKERHESMVNDFTNVLKRITYLQGVIATRHSRQQIKGFVQNHPIAKANSKASCTAMGSDNGNSFTLVSSGVVAKDEPKMPMPVEQLLDTSKHTLNGFLPEIDSQHKACVPVSHSGKEIVQNTCITAAGLRQMQADADSEVTESSSGDDSDDEKDVVSNLSRIPSQNIKKTPCWRWARDRAMVISRWTWLQAQVSDLEYKIRQHGELHKQLRSSKVSFHSELARNQSTTDYSLLSAARCVPLSKPSTPRHKFVRMSQAYALGRKARQHPVLKCQCVQTIRRCVICAGHHHYAKPLDIETLQRRERISNLDPSFHSVLSFPQDVNPAIELEDIVNSNDRKLTVTVAPDTTLFKDSKKELTDSIKKQKLALKLKKSKDKQLKKAKKQKEANDLFFMRKNKKKKKDEKLSKRVRSNSYVPKWEEDADENMEQDYAEQSLSQSVPASVELNRSSTAGLNQKRSAYDIDDIVIPYHLAAATRVEKLQYKEIDTPRWRENLVNGMSVHEQIHRRSSSTSVPMTPVTPSVTDISLPVTESLTVDTAEPSTVEQPTLTPVMSACSLPCSDQSSTPSLANLEIENISDSRYMSMHNVMETKEKSRYMNFVSSNRRVRTQSVTSSGAATARLGVATNPLSPGSQIEECIEVTTTTTSCDPSPISQISPTPLSVSHDATNLREELAMATRKRCSSFTGNRPRKEHSLEVPEEIIVAPWPKRHFPLDDHEVSGLTARSNTSRRGSFHSNSTGRWKVISTEEDHPGNEKHPLVIKLSKS